MAQATLPTLPTLPAEPQRDETFHRWAAALALVTIFYNIVEGVVSVWFGAADETVALFGFGVDSFVEVISGIGIWHMVWRLRNRPAGTPDEFERTALRVTGAGFYLLTAGLVATATVQLARGSRPETTVWGIVISAVSIVSMLALVHYKRTIGRRYGSAALLADANCTLTCIYLSVVLLAASIGYEATGIGLLDSAGALGIAWFSWREGREAFGKAAGNFTCSCQGACGKP
ncbi:MAG TPA: cation transporter [bacterium]